MTLILEMASFVQFSIRTLCSSQIFLKNVSINLRKYIACLEDFEEMSIVIEDNRADDKPRQLKTEFRKHKRARLGGTRQTQDTSRMLQQPGNIPFHIGTQRSKRHSTEKKPSERKQTEIDGAARYNKLLTLSDNGPIRNKLMLTCSLPISTFSQL